MFVRINLISSLLLFCGHAAMAQYVEPAWFARIQAEDTTGILERCQRKSGREIVPITGESCSRFAKICFFGNQDCPDVGPHPTLRCECDGLFAPGATMTWTCTDVPCPTPGAATAPPSLNPNSGTTSPPVQPTAPPAQPTAPPTVATNPPSTGACPAVVPRTGDSCPVNGRTCTYTATSTNQTTACTTTSPCTCSSSTWTCPLPTVNCSSVEPLVCPGFVPKAPAATSCGPRSGTCSYTTTSTNSTDVCDTVDKCNCDGTSFTCEAPTTTCVTRPPRVCPVSIPSSGTEECNSPGFRCTYTSGSSNTTNVCNTTSVCTCGDDLLFGCAPPSTTCAPANQCPSTPSPGGTCTVAGAACNYTLVNSNATARCESKTTCTCGTGLSYSCGAPTVTCTPIDGTCPATQPSSGASCQAQGLSCRYVSQSSNATNICNTTNVCTCGASGFSCAAPTVACIDRAAGTCPSAKPTTGAMCGADIGCTYTSTFNNSTAACTSVETCTCSGNSFTCATPATTCTPVTAPTCPSAPSPGLSCSATFGCTYFVPSSNETTICNTTQLCSCNGSTFSCSTTGTTCSPRAPRCPTSRPAVGSSCDISPDLQCSYLSTLRNDTTTCNVTNVCTCGSGAYACAQSNVQCTQSAPLMCPGTVPSSGSVSCDPNGLTCSYTIPTSQVCEEKTDCTCSNGLFGCNPSELICQ